MPKVYVKTLGCKVNTYDSHSLQADFKEQGYELTKEPSDADISILNTCSVTGNADREGRYLLRKFKKANPKAMIVATGCYAQTDSEKLSSLDEVDLVIPNQFKDKLVKLTDSGFQLKRSGQPFNNTDQVKHKLPIEAKVVSKNRQGHFKTALKLGPASSDRTRAFLKIQDGCNGFCTYCLIPYARGASRSVHPSEVKKEVRRQIELGIGEIVFTGIHIGDYGEDLSLGTETPFVELFREMLDWDDMVRIRISSLEPGEVNEEMLKIGAQRPELFCDHFHLPLQSGHDRILKAMRRSYDTQHYSDIVEMSLEYFPNANIGSDVIPGFPGETEEEFQATVDFIKKTGINYIHVFPYSKRPNTAAERIPGHLPQQIVKERAACLRELSDDLKKDYYRQFINTEAEVLWEDKTDPSGRQVGHTRNYLEVAAAARVGAERGCKSKVLLKGFVENNRLLGI